ncbi:hypothetical protein NIES4101_53830 [Calothrix sp. NIES-4101]|nr:hypothetical protein NIES4101_53830 [Calothrix sp. NIES-4101]
MPSKRPTPINKKEIASIRRDHTLYLQAYTGTYQNPDDVLNTRGRGQYKAYEDLKKDGHTYSVLNKRFLQVISREWKVEPASSKRDDKKAAEMVKYHLSSLAARAEDDDVVATGFDALCFNLLDAILKGYKPAEIIWAQDGNEIFPAQVKTRNQERFPFGVNEATEKWEMRMLTPNDMITGIPVQQEYPRKFFVHSFGAVDDNPYGVGVGRTLWWNVFFKKQGIKFWLQFVDKFASPTAIGKYPKGATQEQKATLLRALNAIATDAGVSIPDGMEVMLLEASRSGSIQCYEGLANYMDSEISKAVLGETLSTQIGDRGSYAAAQTHNEVRMQLAKADADLLSDTLNRTLIKWIIDYNLPNAKPPRLWRDFGEQENLDSRVQRDKTLFDMGFKLKPEAVKEIYGDDYEEVKEQSGEVSQEEFLANSGVNAQATDMVEAPTLSTTRSLPLNAINFADDKDGIDSYTEQLQKQTAPIFADWMSLVRNAIATSSNFEEAQQKILESYPQMDTQGFAEAMGQAMIASEAAGRWEILQESPNESEFAERDRITNAKSLLEIKEILEEWYTDGITAIPEAYIDGETIVGRFEDKVDKSLTKSYRFVITEDEVVYQLLNSTEVANYSENLDFAAKKSTKPKNCTKGTPCGGSCISATKQCRKTPGAAAKKKIAEIKKRETSTGGGSGGGDTINYKINRENHQEVIALGRQFSEKYLKAIASPPASLLAAQEKKNQASEKMLDVVEGRITDKKESKKILKEFRQAEAEWTKESLKYNEAQAKKFEELKEAIIKKNGISEEVAQKWAASLSYKGNLATDPEVQAGLQEVFRLAGGKGGMSAYYISADSDRAYASNNGTIDIGWNRSRKALFHEYAHHIEYQTPGAAESARDWIESRATSKKLEKLRDITGDKTYKDDEVGYRGRFHSDYVGKIYGKRGYPTEVLSMGVDNFASSRDMRRFHEIDREHFEYTVGVLISED